MEKKFIFQPKWLVNPSSSTKILKHWLEYTQNVNYSLEYTFKLQWNYKICSKNTFLIECLEYLITDNRCQMLDQCELAIIICC